MWDYGENTGTQKLVSESKKATGDKEEK